MIVLIVGFISILGLCYVTLFTYFAWEDLRILARKLSVFVGMVMYAVMILFMAATMIIAFAGCGGPQWIDVPSSVVDPQAIQHNERVCAEQGKTFTTDRWRCE